MPVPHSSDPVATERRRFLRIVGLAGVAGVTALALPACDPVPEVATAPWRDAGAHDDPRLAALSWALLAPNPHNQQPWLADLSEPDVIVLRCDRTRLLPETDPFQRQILIGHGCFLELLSMAAAARGYEAEITLYPDGAFPPAGVIDDRPVARVVLRPGPVRLDPLFTAVPDRRSTKEPFDTERAVPAGAIDALRAAIGDTTYAELRGTIEPDAVTALRAITWQAHEIEMLTPRTLMESVNLMRIGADEIARHRDGIDLGGTMMELGKFFGMIDRAALADPQSTAFQQGMDIYRDIMSTAMGYAWIVTPAGDRFAEIDAGRAYMRLDLAAARAGLAIHPVSQVLQEYPEMNELQARFNERLGIAAGERVQMLARLGYAAPVPRSPRRDVKDLVRQA